MSVLVIFHQPRKKKIPKEYSLLCVKWAILGKLTTQIKGFIAILPTCLVAVKTHVLVVPVSGCQCSVSCLCSLPVGCGFVEKQSPPGQGEERRASRRSASGVKEKCIDFGHLAAGYHTFIWALKGPNLGIICIAVLSKYENILLEELSFKVGLNICIGAEALTQFTTINCKADVLYPII